jgi:dTDP-4-amino-4,6-dideoxygalactose transaminase
MVTLGYNWRLSEVAAVIGKHQLRHLEEFLTQRNQVADWYQEALSDVQGVSLFKVPPKFRHSYYKYPLKLAQGIDRISALMKEKYGIESGHVYYPPCHLQPYYMKMFGTREGDFPTAERVLKSVLCLPMHCLISKENVWYIRDALASAISELSAYF